MKRKPEHQALDKLLAHSLKVYLARFDVHYARVIATNVLILSVVLSAFGSVSQILIVPITTAYGWANSDLPLATALIYFVIARMCPFGASLMLNFDVSKIVGIGV